MQMVLSLGWRDIHELLVPSLFSIVKENLLDVNLGKFLPNHVELSHVIYFSFSFSFSVVIFISIVLV